MKRAGWILVAVVSLIAAVYASIFPIAEIFTEVVILRSFDSEGAPHETRVPLVDLADEPWVRGRSYRGWFGRIEANPEAELYRDGAWRPVLVRISRDAADASAFDQVMLETYGRAYRSVDLIARFSANEIPVRLAPTPT